MDRQPGRELGQLVPRAPQLGLVASAVSQNDSMKCRRWSSVGAGDLDREHLRQPRDAGVDQAARLGHQADRVAAVHEGRIAEPVLHDADPVKLPVVQTRPRRRCRPAAACRPPR